MHVIPLAPRAPGRSPPQCRARAPRRSACRITRMGKSILRSHAFAYKPRKNPMHLHTNLNLHTNFHAIRLASCTTQKSEKSGSEAPLPPSFGDLSKRRDGQVSWIENPIDLHTNLERVPYICIQTLICTHISTQFDGHVRRLPGVPHVQVEVAQDEVAVDRVAGPEQPLLPDVCT